MQNFQDLMEGTGILSDFAVEQKKIEASVQAKNIFANKDIIDAITKDLGADIALKVQNILPGELASLDKRRTDVLNKVNKGEFLNSDGSLNITKVSEYVINELKSLLSDFYGGVTSDMSVAELETVYDNLIVSADAKQNSKAIKKAAKISIMQ